MCLCISIFVHAADTSSPDRFLLPTTGAAVQFQGPATNDNREECSDHEANNQYRDTDLHRH
jgi:hypothetical protein